MTVTQIINLLHKSVTDKSYDLVPTEKNRNSRRKYGLTIYDIEDFLKLISEEDLYSGPEIDRDIPSDEVFIFIKEILNGVNFYVKIKKDSKVTYDRIKIISCHEAEYQEECEMKNMDNLRTRKVQVNVKGTLVEYDEYYLVDDNGEEVFDRNIEIENDQRLYDIYKKQNNLLTNFEIKKIRQKYDLTQKEYALVIGVGEVTVHRFEKGAIQTEAVDSIMKLSNDPDNMAFLLLQNRKNIGESLYDSLLKRIKELQVLKRHALVDISKFDLDVLEFEEASAIDVAKNIINIYNAKVDELANNYDIVPEYITNLKLQKLLYFVQAICLMIFGEKAFPEKILAWSYGPVVIQVYQQYKQNHASKINSESNVKNISSGLYKIIEEVINSYGLFEANRLIDLTHEEEPCLNTEINKEIGIDLIKNYFNKVYDN